MSFRACIIGGSLGGLFVGHFLRRAGWEISIHERTETPLSGRGAGIVTYPELEEMVHTCVGKKVPLGITINNRIVQSKNGSIIAKKLYPQVMASWEWLFNLLFDALKPQEYFLGSNCVGAKNTGNGAVLYFDDNSKIEADIAIFADGIYSEHRNHIDSDAKLEYAGYVAWRGIVKANELSSEALNILGDNFAFALPHRQQLLTYPVSRPYSSERSVNYVWYRPASKKRLLKSWLQGNSGVQYEVGIPPHEIRKAVIDQICEDAQRDMPKAFAELVGKTKQPLIQPIYDLTSASMRNDRLLMLGDAAFSARPHVGMGVTKVAEDARLLGEKLTKPESLEDALAEWEEVRHTVGKFIVQRGRDLGSYWQGDDAEDPPEIDEIMANSALRVTDIPDYPLK